MTQDTVTEVLKQRGQRYGEFTGHARISQALKTVIFTSRSRCTLDPDMCEALEMIAHKIARICNGDAHYSDHWTDVAGYAELVAARLRQIEAEQLTSAAESPSGVRNA